MAPPRHTAPPPSVVYRTAGASAAGTQPQTRAESDGEHCFICAAEQPPFWAVADCGHCVCSLCSLRMRLLYANRCCAMCKVESPRVVVVRAGSARVAAAAAAAAATASGLVSDPQHKDILFADQRAHEECLAVTRLRCPLARCGERARAWPSTRELKAHVSRAHTHSFCDICLAHKKVFPSEQRTYTPSTLLAHQRDSHPGCALCGTLFYSEDELEEHRRDRHEACHICQRSQGARPVYHRDYAALEEHFRREHFLCPDPLCLELKFVVFESEIEYKLHMAQVHLSASKMQRSTHRQLCRLDVRFSLPDRRSAREPDRGPDRSTAHDAVAAPHVEAHVRAAPATGVPRAVSQNFVFGESIGSLAERLQSLALYERRNTEFCGRLERDCQLDGAAIAALKKQCRLFQRGSLSAAALVAQLDTLIGHTALHLTSEALLDLELDPQKKAQLNKALEAHKRRLAAFPPLPSLSASRPSALPPATAPTTIRIVARQHAAPSHGRAAIDPSRNPLSLVGPLGRPASSGHAASAGRGKKTPQPPSFKQAISNSPATAAAPITGGGCGTRLSEEEFPSLLATFQATGQLAAPPSSNIFAHADNRNAPASFVIGSAAECGEFDARREDVLGASTSTAHGDAQRDAVAPSRRRKGRVVFRYG